MLVIKNFLFTDKFTLNATHEQIIWMSVDMLSTVCNLPLGSPSILKDSSVTPTQPLKTILET